MNNAASFDFSHTPLVAVIVPIYNDEQYLSDCLDSILGQSASYWEAWLIDDGSSDKSLEIAEKYSKSDGRFHVLKNDKNGSAWKCRASGILSASSSVQYIMFADADDTLCQNAIKTAYTNMKSKPVDILHFGTNVINRGNVSHARIKHYNRYIQPPVAELNGRDIFKSFVERDFEGHLWNKMFNAELLRNIIGYMGEELFLPKAQDKVLYWAVCFAHPNLTYRGIKDKLYNYNYGYGVEGGTQTITLENCRQYLSQAWSENKISEVMSISHAEKEYSDVMENSRYNLIKHSIRNLLRLSDNDIPSALDMACAYWDRPLDRARMICALAEYTWESKNKTSIILKCTSELLNALKAKQIRVVGTYYHRMDNGGIQRVIAKVMEHWHELGLEVVLFTDFDASSDDYVMPEYVTRVKLDRPFSNCGAGNYVQRGMSLARKLREYNIDCMVYHSYFSDVLLYDTCICRAEGVHFILHQHNVFSRYLRYNDTKFTSVPLCSELADGVVCLDRANSLWWSCFNPNTHVVLNPLTFDLEFATPANRNDHTILFLGRLSEEAKHPSHAIDIMAKVVEKHKDAKLLIVGSTEDMAYMNMLKKKVVALGLTSNVQFCGFHRDVEDFYLQSSVFLSCSSHEGFMLTLCEAMSYSIPIVMYELPYLAPVQNNHGIISVPQNDSDAAASAICGLFDDNATLKITGDSGRLHLEKMYDTDISEQWRNVFDSLVAEVPFAEVSEDIKIMAHTLINDHCSGMELLGVKKPPLTFRIKRYYHNYGLKKTISRVFEKLSGN